MDTVAIQCGRLDISFRTVRLSWLVSRTSSSRVSRISKQRLPNTFQFEWLLRENLKYLLKSCNDIIKSRLSTCYGTIFQDTVQLEDHLACPNGGPMESIVTMCRVSCRQMLCCWQQHAQSETANKTRKKEHILCLKCCWMICVDLFIVAVWVFTVSQTDVHTICQYANK